MNGIRETDTQTEKERNKEDVWYTETPSTMTIIIISFVKTFWNQKWMEFVHFNFEN